MKGYKMEKSKLVRLKFKVISIFAIFLFTAKVSLAYIDPGTGSAIAGSIWPLILAFFSAILAFLVKWFWNPIKKTFSKINKRKR